MQDTINPKKHWTKVISALLLSTSFLMSCSAPQQSVSPSTATPEKQNNSKTISYAAQGWAAKTLPELSDALSAGDVSSLTLVEAYLDRIEKIDRQGPTLQAVLSLNPNARDEATRLDELRDAGIILGPLHGIPVLLKDNIESKDNMATTAGALALKNNLTGRDSPHVAGLRAAGAIILGKTNLSQWANYRSNNSMSGWSALGGQVKNPHMLDRNPCGSSSGSGAAVAASLTAGAVGTETNGSIICPANVNGIVGFKPSVGLVSQQFIVPISPSQDTAGPMTKTVKGAAMMLNAMTTDGQDHDFVASLEGKSLKGTRIGVLRFDQGSNPDILENFNAVLAVMEKAGATLIDIDDYPARGGEFWAQSGTVLKYEFKASLNDYLSSTPDTVTTRTLEELIAFNKKNAELELALFDQSIFIDAQTKGGLLSPEYLTARDTVQSATRANGIDQFLADNNVDILVSPSGPISPRIDPINGDVWPEWAGSGYIAAIAGYPHLTVPMSHAHGVPLGVSFIGRLNDDANVLAYGYAYEQLTNHRLEPNYLPSAEHRPEISSAMRKQ